jgi:hypothetical protein
VPLQKALGPRQRLRLGSRNRNGSRSRSRSCGRNRNGKANRNRVQDPATPIAIDGQMPIDAGSTLPAEGRLARRARCQSAAGLLDELDKGRTAREVPVHRRLALTGWIDS